jgi:hypothetical protein
MAAVEEMYGGVGDDECEIETTKGHEREKQASQSVQK